MASINSVPIGEIVFATGGAEVTALLGDGQPVQTQGFGGWEEIERPRRKSITQWKGRQPWRIEIPIMFDRFDEGSEGESVEPDIRLLEQLAGGGINAEPPVCVFNSGGLVPHDYTHATHLRWVLDDIQFGEAIRRRSDGNRVRAEMTVTVLEYVEDVYVIERALTRAAKRTTSARQGAAQKRYTVKRGDTLSRIAQQELGTFSRWREIARLNNIRDPRTLKVGQVLRLP